MIDFLVGEKGAHTVPESISKEIDKKRTEILSPDFIWLALFGLAALAYLFLSIRSIDAKYVDFGDGNYLYLSWRLMLGDILYKDLPSPQPPLLLFLGKWLVTLGDGDAVFVRLWQAIQHVLIACCVLGISNRIFQWPQAAVLAGVIYLFLPEGVWWAAGYQSEPLMVLLQCFNLMLLLTAVHRKRPSAALYGAAFVAAMTCFVNMTAVPYVALQWFFVWLRFRGFFWRYTLALVIPGGLFFIYMLQYSHGQYIEHVFFRQVGTFPAETVYQAVSYFIEKLNTEGGDILFWEGGFLFASLAGALLFANDQDHPFPAKDYILWWVIFSLGSIVFVTKGGTVEYIFTIGEPAVAVFSAYFFLSFMMALNIPFRFRDIVKDWISFGKWTALLCLVLPALLMKPVSLLSRTFFPSWNEDRNQVFELSHETMLMTSEYIQRYCPPEKTLVAPPFYAFLAKRKLAENSSSLFILGHAYYNELSALKKERNLEIDLPDLDVISERHGNLAYTIRAVNLLKKAVNKPELIESMNAYVEELSILPYSTAAILQLDELFVKEPDLQYQYPAIQLFLNLRRQIIEKKVGLILVNKAHFFFFVPPLHQAIRDYCYPAKPALNLPNREEQITAYFVK